MVHSRGMFGMGIGELLIILVVALLVIGPDKLPEAAKSLSKGIRDFRKQTKELQQTIEDDTEIGDAIRDLKSALRGDELQQRPKPRPAGQGKVTGAGMDTEEPAVADAAGAGTAAAGASVPVGAAQGDKPAGAVSYPEPMLKPSAGAVARGGMSGPAPATSAAAAPDAATPAAAPGAPAPSSSDEKAHG